jgi:hypothetical protein
MVFSAKRVDNEISEARKTARWHSKWPSIPKRRAWVAAALNILPFAGRSGKMKCPEDKAMG